MRVILSKGIFYTKIHLTIIDDIPRTLDEYSYVRRKVYDVVSHYKFDLVIAIVIGLNVVFMAIEHNNMSKVSGIY